MAFATNSLYFLYPAKNHLNHSPLCYNVSVEKSSLTSWDGKWKSAFRTAINVLFAWLLTPAIGTSSLPSSTIMPSDALQDF